MTSGVKKASSDVFYGQAEVSESDTELTTLSLSKEDIQDETALYIKDMTHELMTMANHAKLDVVAYLLDMVRAELDNHLNKK